MSLANNAIFVNGGVHKGRVILSPTIRLTNCLSLASTNAPSFDFCSRFLGARQALANNNDDGLQREKRSENDPHCDGAGHPIKE